MNVVAETVRGRRGAPSGAQRAWGLREAGSAGHGPALLHAVVELVVSSSLALRGACLAYARSGVAGDVRPRTRRGSVASSALAPPPRPDHAAAASVVAGASQGWFVRRTSDGGDGGTSVVAGTERVASARARRRVEATPDSAAEAGRVTRRAGAGAGCARVGGTRVLARWMRNVKGCGRTESRSERGPHDAAGRVPVDSRRAARRASEVPRSPTRVRRVGDSARRLPSRVGFTE